MARNALVNRRRGAPGLAVVTQGLAEAIHVGRSNDLELDQILAVRDQTPLAGVVAANGNTLPGGGFTDAQFTVDALAKDAKLAATATAAPLPALRAARAARWKHRAQATATGISRLSPRLPELSFWRGGRADRAAALSV